MSAPAKLAAGEPPVVPAEGQPPARKPLPEPAEGHQDIKKESNPFNETDWRLLVYAWSGLLVRIMLVAGAVFSVYQFLLAREETRVQRALEMVELWEKPEYQDAQRAVKRRIGGLNAKYATLLGDRPTIDDRAFLMKRIGMEAMTEDGGTQAAEEFQEDFERIVYFLNRISFCVEGGLCSRDVIDAYFRDYATSFWAYFAGYAERQRATVSPTYAQPIESYVLGGAKPALAP
ncbi:hypothetical protein [Mesorhizobium sp. KR9-304]|uniref:DUF4760 domain-containing protein n=1 Tax=Mesorhizobium sp. KR9-304 TaxID=3156614 RepID=UPI0032B58118